MNSAWRNTLHDNAARVLLEYSQHHSHRQTTNAHLLGGLVEHLALSRKGARALDEVVELLSTLQNRLDGLVL
jgi:hypothetical protein